MLGRRICSLARLASRRRPLPIQLKSRLALSSWRARYYSSDSSVPPIPPIQASSNIDGNGQMEDELDEMDEEGAYEYEEDGLDVMDEEGAYEYEEDSEDPWLGDGEEEGNEDEYDDDLDVHRLVEGPYPDLMTPDTFMDQHETLVLPPSKVNPYGGKFTLRNDPSMFLVEQARLAEEKAAFGEEVEETKINSFSDGDYSPLDNLPLNRDEMSNLHYYPLFTRRITQQTGKGKIHRQFAMVVVGNGNGLVGYGEGKDEELPRATDKAYAQAVRSMDYVERFENRTVWTEMETKFGATRVLLRPRPLGFGLRCNPNIHQVLKAAGIKDVSAKVWGSRNPLNVIKATFRMLQSGNAPLAMGNGIGGRGRRLDKGSGIRGKGDVERERGRKMIDSILI